MAARFRIHQKFLSEVAKPEEKETKEEVIVLEDGQDNPQKEEKKPKRKSVRVGGLIMRKNVESSFM